MTLLMLARLRAAELFESFIELGPPDQRIARRASRLLRARAVHAVSGALHFPPGVEVRLAPREFALAGSDIGSVRRHLEQLIEKRIRSLTSEPVVVQVVCDVDLLDGFEVRVLDLVEDVRRTVLARTELADGSPVPRGRVSLVAENGHNIVLKDGTPTFVGRHVEGTGRISDDWASGTHAEVRLEGERVEVVDLGSTNGTFVNGIRVDHAELVPGAVLRIGHLEFRLLDRRHVVPAAPVHPGRIKAAAERPRDDLSTALLHLWQELLRAAPPGVGNSEAYLARQGRVEIGAVRFVRRVRNEVAHPATAREPRIRTVKSALRTGRRILARFPTQPWPA